MANLDWLKFDVTFFEKGCRMECGYWRGFWSSQRIGERFFNHKGHKGSQRIFGKLLVIHCGRLDRAGLDSDREGVRLHSREGGFGGVVAAHSVDCAAGRGGGGTEVKILHTGGVMAARRAKKELAKIDYTATDVAAD